MKKNLNENYWLTGHKGFIGTKIKELGDQKDLKLFNISRNYIIEKNHFIKKKVKLDKLNLDLFSNNQNNYLIHCAQYYTKNKSNFLTDKKLLDDNLFFGINILELFNKKFFKKILTMQSCVEFDKSNNQNLYAYSKTLFSDFCSLNYKSHIKVYLYDTFGFNDKRNKIIDFWIQNFLQNKKIYLDSSNSVINITNGELIAKAVLKIKNIKPNSYILHGNLNISLGDLALLIKELTNSKSIIINLKKKTKKPIFKFENLAKKFSLKYYESKFKSDLIKIIENYQK